jgi:hypothetical protein
MITTREQIDAIIRGSAVCRLALAMGDSPYLVPMSFGYDGSAIYLHTSRKGKKIEYFEANSRVCFEFERNVGPLPDSKNACKSTFSFETVIGFGTIRELLKLEQREHALKQIVQQYSAERPDFDDQFLAAVRVWEISIDSLTGKKSPQEEAT